MGALHGAGLAAEKWWADRRARPAARPRTPLTPSAVTGGTVATFAFVVLTWVFFRAPTFSDAELVLARVAGVGAGGALQVSRWVGAYLLVGAVLHWTAMRGGVAARIDRVPAEAFAAALGVGVAVALALQPIGSPPFIYFQF